MLEIKFGNHLFCEGVFWYHTTFSMQWFLVLMFRTPALQAFLGRGDASEGIGRLRRGDGDAKPQCSKRVSAGKRDRVEAKSEKRATAML